MCNKSAMPLRSIAFLLNTPGRTRVAAHACKPIQQEDRAASESKGGSFIAAALGDFHPMRLHASACSVRRSVPLVCACSRAAFVLAAQCACASRLRGSCSSRLGRCSASCKRAARFYAFPCGRTRRLLVRHTAPTASLRARQMQGGPPPLQRMRSFQTAHRCRGQ